MYDHKTRKESPSELRSSMDYINEYVAMPANTMFEEGTIEKMLQEIGFTEIVLMDLSENIRPTLRLFFVLAFVPYFIVKLLGLQTYFVNTMAGYEGYRGRRYWRYVAVTAKKPHNVPGQFNCLRKRRNLISEELFQCHFSICASLLSMDSQFSIVL